MGIPYIFGFENNANPMSSQTAKWTLEYPCKNKGLKINFDQPLNTEKGDRFKSSVS